ncbi:MAG: cytochrome d ubiquinol oxidase subunit II [Tateyamaria sp.]|uniref:cytochrome d ubiquinol oxidase subunit II n=1 Tax=Tateyamaria sp. TaxID=1929288 RepID=UPI00329AD3C1
MLVATIGPFWGANETWLVLAIGPLLVAYSFIGACWLILKTEYTLQAKAVDWAQGRIWGLALGLGAVSIATPLVSPRVFDKWFTYPEIVLLAPMPLLSALLVLKLWRSLQRLPNTTGKGARAPFFYAISLFVLAFGGLAYSFYLYVVPEKLTIYEAASAPESLFIILVGTVFVLPMIGGYTALGVQGKSGRAALRLSIS